MDNHSIMHIPKNKMGCDNVNHPKHYELPGGGETIDFIDAVCGDGVDEYYRGNVKINDEKRQGESPAVWLYFGKSSKIYR